MRSLEITNLARIIAKELGKDAKKYNLIPKEGDQSKCYL